MAAACEDTRVSSLILMRGWRTDARCVYIGMPGYAGMTTGHYGKPWACLRDPRGWEVAYREHLGKRIREDPDFVMDLADLHGKILICFCKGGRRGPDAPCHGDTLRRAVEWIWHGMYDRG